MNPDEFRRKIEPLARVTWRDPVEPVITPGRGRGSRPAVDNGGGATIQELRVIVAKCGDCGIICTQRPTRQFQKRSFGWIEKCLQCSLWRNKSGTFGRWPTKPTSTDDLETNQDCSQAHQLLPIEHDANDSLTDLVDDQDHDQDSVS